MAHQAGWQEIFCSPLISSGHRNSHNKWRKVLCFIEKQSIINKFEKSTSDIMGYNAYIEGITKNWLAHNAHFS